ncbi:hypothetical protein HYR54_07110 [Candidatus Acetothermia bacterium]|nr:hypothetical protein [Candidatus Acetothermia bacterium]
MSSYGLTLASERTVYRPSESIRLSLTLFNRTGQAISLHFKDTQRFDFLVLDSKGRAVFRWSQDKQFAPVLGTETLGPPRPELFFSAEIPGLRETGRYTVQGLVVASEGPLAGWLTLEIRP